MRTYADPSMRRLLTELGIATAVLALAPASIRGAEPLDPEIQAAVEAYVERELAALGVPGAAVAIVRDDEVVFAKGYGKADADGRAVTSTTPFDLASVSKSLTAIAVMQQVDRGALELDAAVSQYLPWYGAEGATLREVTVRDLLGHASGWTLGDGQANLADTGGGPDAIERNVRRLSNTAPSHERGEFEYSNANYDTLALLVETVSGRSFAEYMEGDVFEPLAMEHAHVERAAAVSDGMAHGFYPFFGVPLEYEVPFVPGGVGSGFLHASAEDMAHSLIVHLNEGSYRDAAVLSPEAIRQLHTPVTYADPSSGYAGGLWVHPLWSAGSLDTGGDGATYRVPIMLTHDGDHSSTATGILVLPAQRWGVVVLMNMNDSTAPSRYLQLHYGIATLLLGGEAPETVVWEDPVTEHGKALVLGAIVLQLLGIVVALRRLSRWRRLPDTRPGGAAAVLGHVVAPLAFDLGAPAAFWWLLADRTDVPLPVIALYAPDIALGIAIITLLGIGWGVIRTVLTLRALGTRREFASTTA